MSDEQRDRGRVLSFVLVVAVCLAFANSFGGVFVFDDLLDIVANPNLRRLWPPDGELWAAPGCGLVGRPAVAFSLALNYAISELQTWSYHAFNLAIHAAATVCLFAAVRRLCELPRASTWMRERRDALAFATALLWGVHPLHVGAVTLVIQRCESLMGLCFLAGLVAAFARLKESGSARHTFLAAAFALIGAACKESIALLPLVVFVIDAVFASGSPRAAWRDHRGLYLALALSWPAVALSVSADGLHRASSLGMLDEVTWFAWITTQAAAIVEYLRLVVVQTPIVIDYGWPIPKTLGAWLPQAFVVLALLAAVAWAWRRAPRVAVLGSMFFVLLAPASSFVPIPFELYALHRMYLPLACVVGLAVAGLMQLCERLPDARRRATWIAVVLAAASWSTALTHRANAYFASAERLWRATLEHRPDNDRAWSNLGDALRVRGAREEARDAYRRARELHPSYPLWYNNPALLEVELGHLDAAIELWSKAVELLPALALERENLANALLLRGDAAAALTHFERLLADAPDSAGFLRGKARALARLHRAPEALVAFSRAHVLAPDDPLVFEGLVLLLATSDDPSVRDGRAALELVDGANEPQRSHRTASARLRGAALAELGRFDEAVAEVEKALAIVGPDGPADAIAQLERERELYRMRQPLRDAVP
ncbi:MAG: tetratricopeptide repeat protein [Planctomycetes bacterium]|nr:tetratricopeptide repeat protein [Planctomycetota bacterium]